MPELFDIRVATSAEPPVDPQVSDIYFDAVSISAEPTVAGSDEAFEVANNPATGGGGAAALVPLSIYGVDDSTIGITAGAVNNFVVNAQDNLSVTASTFVYIKITLDSVKDISTVAVHIPNSTAPLASTASIAYVNIGSVNVVGGDITTVTSFSNGSLGYIYGGSNYHYIYKR
jgi:hypothetical protein